MHIQSHKLGIFVSSSDVFIIAAKRKVFWAVWAFLSFSVAHHSYVPLQLRTIEHLRTVRAMFAHIIMNFFDVLCQTIQTSRIELLRTERAIFAHIIMNFFDVSCQGFERHFFFTLRALFLDS